MLLPCPFTVFEFRSLRNLDIDGDGIIDDDEYATVVRCGLVTAAIDLDGDGIIDDDEKAAAVRAGLKVTNDDGSVWERTADEPTEGNETDNSGQEHNSTFAQIEETPTHEEAPQQKRDDSKRMGAMWEAEEIVPAPELEKQAAECKRSGCTFLAREGLEYCCVRCHHDMGHGKNCAAQEAPKKGNTDSLSQGTVEVKRTVGTANLAAAESKLNSVKLPRSARRKLMLDAFVAVDPDDTDFAPRLDLRQEIETYVASCAQVQQLVNHVKNLDCMVVEKDDFEEIVQEWLDGAL